LGLLHIGQIQTSNDVTAIHWFNCGGPQNNNGQGTQFGTDSSGPSVALSKKLALPAVDPNQPLSNSNPVPDSDNVVVAIAVGPGGLVEIDSFDTWKPMNGNDWLKFSGLWGNKATRTIFVVAGHALAQTVPSDPGPAYRSTWLAGPV
jgi:hypothetical protein